MLVRGTEMVDLKQDPCNPVYEYMRPKKPLTPTASSAPHLQSYTTDSISQKSIRNTKGVINARVQEVS